MPILFVNSENSRTFADENNIFVIYKFVKLENIWNSTVEISLQTLEDKFANIRPHFRGYEVQFVALSLGDMWRRGIIGTAQMIRWIHPPSLTYQAAKPHSSAAFLSPLLLPYQPFVSADDADFFSFVLNDSGFAVHHNEG